MSDHAAAAVQAGASLLDVDFPGWADEIDLATLDVGIPAVCIIGQLYGDGSEAFSSYRHGLSMLNVAEHESAFYGFSATEEDNDDPEDEDYYTYGDLQPLWVAAITNRRS